MNSLVLGLAKKVAYPALDALWAVKRNFSRHCPICGRTGTFDRVRGYDRVFLRCPACSHVWAHDYSRLRANLGMGMEGNWGMPDSGGEAEEFIARFSVEQLGVRSVLLYGTGPTRALRSLLGDGFDAYGCDVSRNVIEFRQREFGAERFFHIRDMGARHYDLVVATEVIEHLFDPLDTLRSIARVLRPGGVFAGTTNFSLHGEVEDDKGLGYMRPRNHLVYWSERSLRAAFGKMSWQLRAFGVRDARPANKRVFFGTDNAGALAALDKVAELPFTDPDAANHLSG